jgi:hypothetical protein
MTTQATNVIWRKLRRHQALVTKNAKMKVIANIAAIMKHGQMTVITEGSN